MRRYKSPIFLITLIILIPLLEFSCEKKVLEPDENGVPQLYFEALINGVPLKYEAGKNNIIGNSFYSTYYQDSLLVYHFSFDNLYYSTVSYLLLSVYNYTFPVKSWDKDIDSTIIPGKYHYMNTTPLPGNPKRLKEVSITLYSHSGSQYSSSYFDQQYSNFEILDVKDTVVNIKREKYLVKKAVIVLNCTLKNRIWGDTINLSTGKMSVFFKRPSK